MPRFTGSFLGVLTAILLILGPLAYSVHYVSQARNFRVVREGILYRSGQMSEKGLKRVVNDYNIKTVISLRDAHRPGDPPPDLEEEEYCKRVELNYFRIPPRHWERDDGPAPAEQGVRKFIDIMSDPRHHPVLVHCFGGIHRAGAFSAIYRMEFDGWSNEQAIVELKANGYTNLGDHWDILGYMEKYVPTSRRRAEVKE